MLQKLYYKKLLIKTVDNQMYKGFLGFYKSNIYVLFDDLYKHDI